MRQESPDWLIKLGRSLIALYRREPMAHPTPFSRVGTGDGVTRTGVRPWLLRALAERTRTRT
ncbi:hypothetical protein [Streptomyces melanogenes]|uniref:hypothetical protein n=1 Tax=Streptomyces melanogenes TaxID=67326 RepID=UPI0037BA0D7C